jgi:hypothetical protein
MPILKGMNFIFSKHSSLQKQYFNFLTEGRFIYILDSSNSS